MALLADRLLDVFIEVIAVACDALIVAGPLKSYRSLFDRDVAHVAFESAAQLVLVESVNEEFFLPWLRVLRKQRGSQQRQGGEE